MRHVLSPSVAPLLRPYFLTLSRKRRDFLKNVAKHTMCVFFSVRVLSEIFLILRRIERDIIINVYMYSSEGFDILMRL
jgi:hypothetical protein